jgi:hypothetical protein
VGLTGVARRQQDRVGHHQVDSLEDGEDRRETEPGGERRMPSDGVSQDLCCIGIHESVIVFLKVHYEVEKCVLK